MPYLLRRRLVCFYCGHKSSQTRDPSIRQWHCSSCDAVNYLDENGDITDPPAAVTPENPLRYGTAPTASISPELVPGNNVFCPTCQKNQHIYLESLNNYLPDPSDPDYAKFEASLPEFKRELEKRYPLICSNCVGAANNRIQDVSRLAKKENLKLALERTRRGQVQNTRERGWRDLVILAGAGCWWASVIGQVVWHILGILVKRDAMSSSAFPSCILSSIITRSTDIRCYGSMTAVAHIPLYLAVASVWWNNKLSGSAKGLGRLNNLNDYYLVQVLFFGARLLSFWFLTSSADSQYFRAIHAFMLVFSIVIAFLARRLVKIKSSPALKDYKLHLVEAPEQSHMILEDQLAISTPKAQQSTAFPISSLAASTPQQRKLSLFTNTPSFSEASKYSESTIEPDAGSEMDWSPTIPSFTPRQPMPRRQVPTPAINSPSPFRGNLPPAPQHPYHKALKPKPVPVFMRKSEEARNDFQDQMMGESREAMFGETAFELNPGKRGTEMQFQEPKLRNLQQETGLELLFNDIFSIQDGPQIPNSQASSQHNTHLPTPSSRQSQPISPQRRRLVGTAFWTLAIAVPLSLAAAWTFYAREGDFGSFAFDKDKFGYQGRRQEHSY